MKTINLKIINAGKSNIEKFNYKNRLFEIHGLVIDAPLYDDEGNFLCNATPYFGLQQPLSAYGSIEHGKSHAAFSSESESNGFVCFGKIIAINTDHVLIEPYNDTI